MVHKKKKLLDKRYVIPLLTTCTLGCLLAIFVKSIIFESRSNMVSSIVRDLTTLTHIFKTIDSTCEIIDFDYEKSSINFLNVASFAGSGVGSMNLRYPDKWQGPYVKDNPVIQRKEYQIVSTVRGYFITPGDGVKLPNGKVIGVDLKLDKNADIAAMMHQKDVLLFENQSLAAPLSLPSHVVRSLGEEEDY